LRRPPTPAPFPYTPLFRSAGQHRADPLAAKIGRVSLEIARADPSGEGDVGSRRPQPYRLIGAGATRALADGGAPVRPGHDRTFGDRKSTRLNSSHVKISYA